MTNPTTPQLTALDWVAVATTAVGAFGLVVFPFTVARAFAVMFADFGGTLPGLTLLVISPWFAPALGAVAMAALGWAAARPGSLTKKRALIGSAFVATAAVVTVCVVGLYLPVFEMAAAVRPE